MGKKIKSSIPFKCPHHEFICPYVDQINIKALKKCIDCEFNVQKMNKEGLLEWLNKIICTIDNGYIWRELSEFDLALKEYLKTIQNEN